MPESVHRTHEQLEEWLERSGRALDEEVESTECPLSPTIIRVLRV